MSDLKDTIELSLDASGVETGVGRARHSLESLGNAASSAGEKAATGFNKFGEGGKAAADKIERDTRRMVQQIERVSAEMEAGGRNTAAYFEARARQMGVATESIQPYIDKLRASEAAQLQAAKGMQNMGMSAGQMGAAMRGLPAQIQDVVVSLQGGQRPMTVLLQQGSQITTQFGGISAALQGVATYALGLVNPFTLAAAAIGTVGGVVYLANSQMDALRDKVDAAGRTIGYTTGELYAMAGALNTGWSQSANATALAEIASSAALSGDELKKFTTLAVDLERTAGKPVADTAKLFRELGEAPADAVKKLAKETDFLTAAQYEQIKALEDQGRKTDAARVAMGAYADGVKPAVDRAKANLGALGTALDYWRQKALDMWAAVAGAARAATGNQTGEERAADAQRRINEINSGLPFKSAGFIDQMRSFFNPEGVKRELLGKAQQELAYINQVNAAAAQNAKFDQEREARQKAGRDAIDAVSKAYDGALTKGQRMNKELTEFRANLDKIKAASPDSAFLDPKRIAAAEAAIRDKYKESGGGSKRTAAAPGENEVARIKALIAEEQAYTKALQERGAEATKMTAGEKLVMQIQEQLSTSIKGVARSNKEAALAEAQKLVQAEKARQVEERRAKALQEAREANERLVADTWKTADGIEKQAAELDAANSMWGKGKVAVEEYRLAQAKEMLAMADASDSFIPGYVKALQAVVDARQHMVDATKDLAFKQLSQEIQEWSRQAEERARLYADEQQLSGLTALERAKITAAREVELKLAREIDRINKSGLDDAQKQALITEATAAAAKDKSAAVARVVQEDWARTSDQINQSLTDALLRGFESGKDFAKNFRDTLLNMFKTLVLRPVIQATLAPVAGGMAALMGGNASAGQGGIGQASNALSMGSILRGGVGAFGTSASWGLTNVLAGNIGSTFGGAMSMLGAGQIGSGLGALAGAAAPALLPLLALVGSGAFSRKHEQHNLQGTFGGASGFEGTWHDYYRGGLFRSSKTEDTPLDSGTLKALRDAWKAQEAAVTDYAQTLGLATDKISGFTYAVNLKLKDLGDPNAEGYMAKVMQRVTEALAAGSDELAQQILGTWTETTETVKKTIWTLIGGDEGWANVTTEETVTARTYAQSQYQREGEKAIDTLTRLATSLKTVNGVFDTLGLTLIDASLAGGDLASKLVDAFGGTDQTGAAFGSYYERYYSEQEQVDALTRQLTGTFRELGFELPATRKELRRWIEEQQDSLVNGNANAATKLAGLVTLATPFDELTARIDALRAAAAGAGEAVDELGQDLSDVMIDLLAERQRLNADLLEAQGDLSAAVAARRAIDIAGYTAEETAAYDANAAIRAHIAELNAQRAAVDAALNAQRAAADAALNAQRAAADASAAITRGLADTQARLAIELLQVQGNLQAAADAQRALDTRGYDAAQLQMYDANAAIRAQIEAERLYQQQMQEAQRLAEQQAQQAAQEAQRRAQQQAQEAQRAAEEEARRQQAIANERMGLTKQLLQLEGNTNLLRQMELEALDPSNRALQQRIWAIEDETAAAEKYKSALKDAQDFLGGFTRNIEEFIFKVSHAQADAQQSYQMAAAKFTAQMTLARGGDRDAMNGITGYADTLIGSIRRESTTGAEANLRIARVLGQLASLPKQISPEQLIVDAIASANTSLEAVLNTNFSSLDANVDGLLTAGELAASGLATNTQISALMARVDANGDGMISKQELANSRLQTLNSAQTTANTSLGSITAAQQAANTWLGMIQSSDQTYSLANVNAINSSTSATVAAMGSITGAQNSTNSWLSQIQLADVGYSLSNINAINTGTSATVAAINKTNASLGVALVRNYDQTPVVAQFSSDSPLFSIFAAINETNAWLYHIHGLETANIAYWKASIETHTGYTVVESRNRNPQAGTVFADGGYTGAGGKWQPAGVVHKGEVVWSQADVARWGGPGIVDALRQGAPGYADGGPVAVRVPQIYVPPVGRSNEETQALLREVLAELRAQRSDDRARHNSLAEPLQRMDRRGAKWDRDGLPAERTNEAIA